MDPKAVYGKTQADLVFNQIGVQAGMALAHYALLMKRCGVKYLCVSISDPTV